MTEDEAWDLLTSMVTPGAEGLYDQDWDADTATLMATYTAVVLAERERCAKIAEAAAQRAIAAKIRSGE